MFEPVMESEQLSSAITMAPATAKVTQEEPCRSWRHVAFFKGNKRPSVTLVATV